jgi:cytochrome c-type biogenesis protein CcmF
MIVHLGVVVIAVAFAASSSYVKQGEFQLSPGQSATVGSHTVTYEGVAVEEHAERVSTLALIRIDGKDVYRPSVNRYKTSGQVIGEPSVRPSLVDDVYLTLVQPPGDDGKATIRVVIEPLVSWLWLGGGIMALGTLLALFPGHARRRPTAAVSAPIPGLVELEESARPVGVPG